LNQAVDSIKASYSKAVAYLLVFSFPLAGNSVAHWTSALFVLIAIYGLLRRPWRNINLEKNEKLLLYVFLGIIFAYVASGIANDWSKYQTRGLSVYLRWLLAVPVYFLVRAYPRSIIALILGSFFGLFVLLWQVYIEGGFVKSAQVYGVYNSPGSIGFYALVFSALSAFYFQQTKRLWGYALAVISGVLGGIIILESGSRSTYVVVLLSSFLFLGYLLIWERRVKFFLIVFALIAVLFSVGYGFNSTVKQRTNLAIAEIANYIQDDSPVTSNHASVGTRFELWRMAVLLFKEHPFFGVGWRGYSDASERFVAEGLLNKNAVHHPHPHNAYLDILAGIGLLGALFFLLLFLLGVRRAIKNKDTLFGIFILIFMINMINEGGSFIYNNALSFFLVFFIVLYATSASRNEAAPRAS